MLRLATSLRPVRSLNSTLSRDRLFSLRSLSGDTNFGRPNPVLQNGTPNIVRHTANINIINTKYKEMMKEDLNLRTNEPHIPSLGLRARYPFSNIRAATASVGITTASVGTEHFGESPLASILPVNAAEHFLTLLHSSTGLPWWASLSLGALCFRLLASPATLIQLKTSAKLSRFAPIISHCMRLFVSIPKLPSRHFRKHSYRESFNAVKATYHFLTRDLPKPRGIGLFLPMTIAIPAFMTFNIACRRILASDYPGISTEGPFWCGDLSSADPTHVFPILALAATVINLHFLFTRFVDAVPQSSVNGRATKVGDSSELGSDTKNSTKAFANTLCFGLQGIAVVVTPFLVNLPSGMFLYWIIAMTVSTFQNRLLRTNAVRRWAGFNLPAFSVETPGPQNPLKTKSVFNFMSSGNEGILLLPPAMSVDKAYQLERLESSRKEPDTRKHHHKKII